jgi:hypothetical protein
MTDSLSEEVEEETIYNLILGNLRTVLKEQSIAKSVAD